MNQAFQKIKKASRQSMLPYWNPAVYSQLASPFYEMATTLTGWKYKVSHYALRDFKPSTLLDLGCGTGFVLNLALEKKFDAIGVDASQGMLDKAFKKYGISKNNLINAFADKLPFKNENFDIILCCGSLVHIPDLQPVVWEIFRILKNGGHLRIIDHAKPFDKNLLFPFYSLFSHLSGDVIHDYDYFFKSGFKLLSKTTLGRGGYLQCFDFIKTADE